MLFHYFHYWEDITQKLSVLIENNCSKFGTYIFYRLIATVLIKQRHKHPDIKNILGIWESNK